MIGLFMILERAILDTRTQVQLGIALIAVTGMFFLRRKQRIKKDKLLASEIDKLTHEEEYEGKESQ